MFEEKLKLLMKQQKITHEELGKAIGVSSSAISMMVSGARKPSFETLNALCKQLNTSPNFLMGFDDDITPQDRAILSAIKSATTPKQNAPVTQNPSKQTTLPARNRGK